jgi:rRNA-processing protein EBP2
LAAQAAVRKFESSSKPFFRPPDYFAEMIKSDAHMETIRLRLVEEAEGLKASEEAKKKRELKKFGKAIQVENKLQREKEAKRIKEGVKELRKSSSRLVSMFILSTAPQSSFLWPSF